jgi:hypothetical protein
MRGRVVRVAGLSAAALCLVLACGARTGIYLESAPADAGVPVDGHLLDVVTECNDPPFCRKDDPGFVYKCGVRIEQCGSLEQCEDSCGDASGAGEGDACAAGCVNPCRDTLGQNTSNGCEFYAAEMDLTEESEGACYAVFVVNQWQTGQPAKLEVDLGGTVLPIEQFARIPTGSGTNIVYSPFVEADGLAKNQVAILFLSRDSHLVDASPIDPARLANCPPGVIPAIPGDGAIHGTGIGNAFHVLSNVPIVAYQMLPYGGGHARVTGATLLLPTNVWGTNYIAANAYSVPSEQVTQIPFDTTAGPTMAILAQEDATHVTINPVAPILAGGGLAGTPSQTPITYTIDKGQYLQFTQPIELTGSPIQSDRPVAVIGGSTLMDVPVTQLFRGDSAEQMLPPVSALGSEYVAVRYRTRNPPLEESTRWRIVGAVDGTVLTYDPAPPPGAPLGINHGEFQEIEDPGPWVVSSQDSNHPFYFAQYMTAGGRDGPDASDYGVGDPEFVNVIAPQQYLPRYTFFTDPTYPETNLVVVAAKDPLTNQFPSVNLDCAGTLTGWQPVGILGKYQFTRIDLSTGNYQGQNGCNNGVHTIQASSLGSPLANAAIGVTIWGWGSSATGPECNPPDPTVQADPNFTCWVSYAYPAGANITKLNDVIVPAN